MANRAAHQGYSILEAECTTYSEFESDPQARMQMSEQCKTPKTPRARAVSQIITLIMRIVERQENTEIGCSF